MGANLLSLLVSILENFYYWIEENTRCLSSNFCSRWNEISVRNAKRNEIKIWYKQKMELISACRRKSSTLVCKIQKVVLLGSLSPYVYGLLTPWLGTLQSCILQLPALADGSDLKKLLAIYEVLKPNRLMLSNQICTRIVNFAL